jgi:integrase
MQVNKFTAIGVEAIRPKAERFEVTDGQGLRLFVFPSGAKSWGMRYRPPGSRKVAKLMFGKWPAVTLAEARVAVANAKREVSRGVDPAAAKKKAKAADEIAAGNTLRAVVERYFQQPEVRRLRTADQRRATFERLIFDKLGGRPIHEIKRSEVVRLLDDVAAKRGLRAADEALFVLRVVHDWYAVRDEDFRPFLVKGMRRTTPKSRRRTRVLDDHELRAVWLACEGQGVFGAYVRFLLLTATRRTEAARTRWDEIKGDTWVIPAERFKSEREHTIPLSKAALALLEKQPRIMGCGLVFTNGQRAIAGFSRYKAKLDKASGVTGWRLHDLRRVSRSLLSRAGINADVAEMCLGHTLGGLRATYDQHRYEAEKRHAFEALAAQIEQIVQPPTGNVVQLRG